VDTLVRENKAKFIILGLLSHEPMTGYDLRQTAERSIGNFWTDLSYGQIYPTLKTLEKQGLVSKTVEVEEKQRLRKVYSITPEGIRDLQNWLMEPADTEIFKLDILLKLYFGAKVGIEHSIKNVETFKQRNEAAMERYDVFEKSLQRILHENEDHAFFLLTLQYGQYITRAQLQWANKALETLRAMPE
jgi:DNA-binding PadR family transcriptional regulator